MASSPRSETVLTEEALARRHIVLVGMMASGKTTVGRLLANRLGRRFVDSDEQVEARTGHTVRELFALHGEPYFRERETEALADALAMSEPTVIAAAGGVVLAEANRRALRSGTAYVVWLRAEPKTLRDRIGSDPGHRPLLDDDPDAALARLSAGRAPLYSEVADRVIDVAPLTPDQVADEIVGVHA